MAGDVYAGTLRGPCDGQWGTARPFAPVRDLLAGADVAFHRMADHHRQQRERIALEGVAPALSESGPGPEAQVLRRDRPERVAQALDELTPDRQEALALRFFGELSNREAAQVMGKSEAAVKMLVCRALRQLRRRRREDG